MTTPPTNLQSLSAAKERAVKLLGDAFAADAFEMDELESRLAQVYRATTVAELDALTRDVQPARMPAGSGIAPLVAGAPLVVRSVLSSTRRAGRWTVPARLEVRALLGDVTIDLRDAELPAGGCEIVVRSTFANVQVIVAPGTTVDTSVSAVLSNVEDVTPLSGRTARGGPLVRITGRALFANVEVKALPTGADPDDG